MKETNRDKAPFKSYLQAAGSGPSISGLNGSNQLKPVETGSIAEQSLSKNQQMSRRNQVELVKLDLSFQ